MVNIISGEKIVPELIQNDVNEKSIYQECRKILTDTNLYDEIKSKYEKLKEKLGSTGTSARAADIIYSLINET